MIPLHLALLHRGHWYNKEPRIDGHFAYPVPGLTWEHHDVERDFCLDIKGWKDVDVVWLDDGKYSNPAIEPHKGNRISPVVYRVLWPTLGESIHETKRRIAERMADLVLLDHDKPENWYSTDFQVRQLPYAVNERYYRDRGLRRDIDVGFYCVWQHSPARPAFSNWLADYCKRRGWVYWTTGGQSVNQEYASLLARTKVVVHLNRTANTRPARIFDCAAAGAAFLSNPMPPVIGECWMPGVHYLTFDKPVDNYVMDGKPRGAFSDKEMEGVELALDDLIGHGFWEPIAANAKTYTLACHTWERRSWELRGILLDCFPHLRRKVGEQWAYT